MILTSIPLFISGAEIAFILFIVLMVFGADKVPEIARGLGKGMRQIKDATNDIKTEITKSAEKQGIDVDITKDVRSQIDKVKEDVDDITGPIKRQLYCSIPSIGGIANYYCFSTVLAMKPSTPFGWRLPNPRAGYCFTC